MPQANSLPNVWIPYIRVTFRNISLTWRGDENRPDYFTSLSHDRVVNKASTLKLNITYAPKYGEDPNRIENAIVQAKGECYVQYGYIAGMSVLYKALVHNYKVAFNEGVLEYSMELLSYAVTYNFSTVPFVFKTNYTWMGQTSQLSVDDLMYNLKSIISIYAGDHYEFDIEGSTGVGEIVIPAAGIEVPSGLNPIKCIQEIASRLLCSDGKSSYTIEIDDSGTGKGKIRLHKYNPDQIEKTYQFDWGKRDGTVLSFTPDFNGAYAIFSARGDKEAAGRMQSNTDDNGQQYSIFVPSSVVDVSSFNSYGALADISTSVKTVNDYILQGNYCYNATLTVLGEPRLISCGKTVIYVNPLIMGKSHHSAGNYVVNSVVDNISASGFTTTYQLRRAAKNEVEKLYDETKSSESFVYVNGTAQSLADYIPEKEG